MGFVFFSRLYIFSLICIIFLSDQPVSRQSLAQGLAGIGKCVVRGVKSGGITTVLSLLECSHRP